MSLKEHFEHSAQGFMRELAETRNGRQVARLSR